jgi:uncharacterized membrane protein YjjP (DUF1212 family)
MNDSAADAIAFVADDPKAVFIASIARELHRAGVATDALEQTLDGIARAIDLPVQVFALPTYLTIAIGPEHKQKMVMMRMDPGEVNLRKIALLNEIYDDLRVGKIDFSQATKLVNEIDARWPGHAPWLRIPGLALTAIGVAILLGGGFREVFVAALIGTSTGIISAIARRNPVVERLYEVLAAFTGTMIVAVFHALGGQVNLYIPIVAGVVVLLPGYSLTLALHELANHNLVAGVARLGKVLSTLLALGCGALLGFALAGSQLLLRSSASHPQPVGVLLWLLAIVLFSTGISIVLDARLRDFVWVFAASFAAIATSHAIALMHFSAIGPLVAALICGLVASLGARFLRVPQPVMLVPAILALVPGSLSYQSILFAVESRYSESFQTAANAVVAAILLVAGLLLSQLLLPATTLRTLARRGGTR